MKKIYVVGIGPGDQKKMTVEAQEILGECSVIIGYTKYIEIVQEYLKGKKYMSTPMTREAERCNIAFEEAMKDQRIGFVCSGDPGVYGMAGLLYELSPKYPDVEIEVVPGVTALLSGAAVLGAPLIHDFSVISLSDRLTSWELIEKRLLASAEADFVICIYNPSSKGRKDHLKKACDILLRIKAEDTVCGLVRNIGRPGQESRIMTLAELREAHTDMFTTCFIGNSSTMKIGNAMVTLRGYKNV